ncbi:MAG: hypothetical protein NVS4B3_24860 [Gemmatimonadaceae bacterium]
MSRRLSMGGFNPDERWWSPARAVGVGLAATIANALAIRLFGAAGIGAGTSGFSRWAAAHANALLGTTLPVALGPVAQETFHTLVGLVSALIYAGAAYPLLPGPRWLRGLVYVQGMWLVQATLVLPWLHQGYFGIGISRTTPIWSWALNALYGLVLGTLYRPGRRGALRHTVVADGTARCTGALTTCPSAAIVAARPDRPTCRATH